MEAHQTFLLPYPAPGQARIDHPTQSLERILNRSNAAGYIAQSRLLKTSCGCQKLKRLKVRKSIEHSPCRPPPFSSAPLRGSVRPTDGPPSVLPPGHSPDSAPPVPLASCCSVPCSTTRIAEPFCTGRPGDPSGRRTGPRRARGWLWR